MPKKNKNKNKKKNKYSSDSLTVVQSIFLLAVGGIFLFVTGGLIYNGVRFALFKYDANSCNKGEQSKCDKLLNYDDYILENNAESVTNPYFKKIYGEYQSDKEYQLNKMFNKLYADDCVKSMGEDIACLNIETEFLDDDLINLVKPFIEKHKKINKK